MHITVTGGFGFVGSLCAEFFRRNGNEVTIVARKIPDGLHQWSKDFKIIIGDVTDKTLDIDGDLVVHCAALNETKTSSPEEFMKVNADGTKNLIKSCIRNSAGKFVKISTFHIYGRTEGIISEDTTPEPKTPYAISQAAADEICTQYAKEINTSVIRLSNIFGPPVHNSVDRWTLAINNFCLQAAKKGTIVLNTKGLQKRDFISTHNAMAAINTVALSRATGEIFNAGGSNVISVRDAAERVAENFEILYGRKVKIITGDKEEKTGDFVYSIDKIKNLGYRPRNDMDRTIKEIFAMCDRV